MKSVLENFEAPKTAIFAHLEALNFGFYDVLQFLKAEIDQINKIQSTKMAKNGLVRTSRFSNIDFT